MLILIADDMPMNRNAVKDVLRKMYSSEAKFLQARTAEEVQAFIEQGECPDLIICDQNFDDIDQAMKGTDVIRWLREEMGNATPIVLFTSDSSAAWGVNPKWQQVKVVSSVGGLRSVVENILGW